MSSEPTPVAPETEIAQDRDGHRYRLLPMDCPTCGPGPIKTIGLRGGRYHRYGLGITSTVVQCRRCALLFASPLPIPIDPQPLYGDPESYFSRHPEEARILEYRDLVKEVIRRTGKTNPSILDVGSGRGDFLHAAALEGLTDTVGLEFADAMVSHARNHYSIELTQMPLEDYARTTSRTFDAVVLNAIIEHVYDPDAFVAHASKLLGKGGVLYIDTPNEPSLLTRIGNTQSRLLRREQVYNLSPTWPPYHLFGFNRDALDTLLRKHGFEIQSVRIHNDPHIYSRGGLVDRIRSFVGTQILRVANVTGTSSNMFVWAKRV